MEFLAKKHWPSYLILLYVVLAFGLAYIKISAVQIGALALPVILVLFHKYEESKMSLKELWPFVAIVFIINLSIFIRVSDYGWPYLRNIDSYSFFRQMEMIVEQGQVIDDPLYFRSAGSDVTPANSFSFYWYQWIGAYSYMLVRIFLPDLQLWQYLIYLPAILVSVSAIPMYYIGKTLFDRKAGALAAFFVVFDVSNVSRSLGGDPDSDAIIILLPLIVFSLFLVTFDKAGKSGKFDRSVALYSILTGIMLFIWRHSWSGYFYTIWLMAGLLTLKLVANIFQTKYLWGSLKFIKPYAFVFLAIIMTFLVFDFPKSGLSQISEIIGSPLTYQEIKSESLSSFPNVYVSVAELQSSGGVKDIIQRLVYATGVGVMFSPFFLSVIALVYLGYAYFIQKSHETAFFVLFMWFIGPFIATLVAVRFSILFAAPMALGAAITFSWMIGLASGKNDGVKNEK